MYVFETTFTQWSNMQCPNFETLKLSLFEIALMLIVNKYKQSNILCRNFETCDMLLASI